MAVNYCDDCGNSFENLPVRNDTGTFCSEFCRNRWTGEVVMGDARVQAEEREEKAKAKKKSGWW